MCGIAGLFYKDGRPVEQRRLDAMTDALVHRGPDDRGTWIEGSIGLGHRRLSIRDLSSAGRQPMADASGRMIATYNGEIYNYAQLRRELETRHGVRFRTVCDTELLPEGYLVWGERLFDRIEGMFAVAIWDRDRQQLTLARDCIGIKPIFVHSDSFAIRFASEIKGVLADDHCRPEIDNEGLHRFLAQGYPGPTRSMLRDIAQVPPGSIMQFSATTGTERQFWRPKRTAEIRSLKEASEAFLPLWQRVVADHLISDVPLGVFQSGGIDSTLVTLAANLVTDVPGFTASFSEASFDEAPAAIRFAESIGSRITSVAVDVGRAVASTLPHVVRHYDGQVCDEASLPLFLLAKETRKHVTVALSGDGGDEFFGGYPTYNASRAAALVGPAFPASAWQSIARISYKMGGTDHRRLPLANVISRFSAGTAFDPLTAHVTWRRWLPEFLLEPLYGNALRPLIASDPFCEYRASHIGGSESLLDRCLLADQRFHLPGGLLLKTDAMTMAHGLETRVPFLDRRVMDFAGRCAASLLVPLFGPSKPVLRAAVRHLGGPDEITHAKKRGFNAPLARLLRNELAGMTAALLDGKTHAGLLEPYFQPQAVRRLWHEHRDGIVDHAYALWPILNFAVWRAKVPSEGYATDSGAGSTLGSA